MAVIAHRTGLPADGQAVQVIELYMMDKTKYFPLTILSGFSIRTLLYPFTLVRTRLQVQKRDSMYRGTYDAFSKIGRAEGVRGLYKGFWVTNLSIVPSVAYISTYEGVRKLLSEEMHITNNQVKSFIGGGCASMVAQTFVVPIDVISQHIMMLTDSTKSGKPTKGGFSTPLKLPEASMKSSFGRSVAVTRAIYRQHGVKGFYMGYLASLAVYAPNSAMWWFFYDIYCGMLSSVFPIWVPRLAIQSIAGPLGGMTTAFVTNPLDTVRARIQVEGTRFGPTLKTLWREEHLRIFVKGLSARLVQSVTFSFFIITCYESIKRISLLDEYKHQVTW